MIIPIILAGGSGSRLWPLSRSAYPKQFLPLVNADTMLQNTIMRAGLVKNSQAPWVICHEEHRFLVAEQLRQMDQNNLSIILEPVGKNTAPAIAMAALHLLKSHDDPILFVLPADHIIKDTSRFVEIAAEAERLALQDKLVTFGVFPTHPETGYGYVKIGTMLSDHPSYRVEEFVEKPDIDVAKKYIVSGQYYWNSGIFMFRAATFIAELGKYAPEMLAVCRKTEENLIKNFDFTWMNKEIFELCPSDSIDYAVMEKTQHAALVPFHVGWSDVGSWTALLEAHERDVNGNLIQGDVMTEEVSNSYLRAESRMLAAVGVMDHIVIETADVVLVAHKNHTQAVKTMVDKLKQNKRSEIALHRKVYRPWGWYETIDRSDSFQVKRITVKPGGSLSLQMHHHRSEHWIVVKGVATVTRGDEIFTIKQNESTYIPLGIKHRLINVASEMLELIEVQSGNYLSEDDIVRFEDVYGRVLADIENKDA